MKKTIKQLMQMPEIKPLIEHYGKKKVKAFIKEELASIKKEDKAWKMLIKPHDNGR